MIHIVNNPNLYHYVLTTFIERHLLPENRLNTALGGLAILGLLTAAITQPTIGVLSDRTRSRLGPRYPFFIGGAIATLLIWLVMVNATSWLTLIVMVVLVQFSINLIQSPLQALIPDYVPPDRMGMASGVKTILELVGIIASGLVVWALLGIHTQPELAVVFSCGVLFVAIFLSIRVAPYHAKPNDEKPKRLTVWERYLRWFGKNRRFVRLQFGLQHIQRLTRQRPLQWWLAGRFFFYASFNTIGRFAITYLQDVFGYSGEEARAIQGIVVLLTGIMIFATTLWAGILADRMGRKKLATMGAGLSAFSALLLTVSPNLVVASILIMFVGIGSGIYFSAGWALATYLVPTRQAAFYLGFMNLATTLGGAFGMLGGFLVDRINDAAVSPTTGYAVLFALTALFFGLGAVTTSRIHDPDYKTKGREAYAQSPTNSLTR